MPGQPSAVLDTNVTHIIERFLHRSVHNFMVNLLGGLIAYTYHPIKPSLDLENKGLPALPPAIF